MNWLMTVSTSRASSKEIKKENSGRWSSRMSDHRDLLLQPRVFVPLVMEQTEDNEEAEVVHDRNVSTTISEDL
jgi:hypothetical protein